MRRPTSGDFFLPAKERYLEPYTRSLVADLSQPVSRDLGLPAGLKRLGDYMKKHNLQVARAGASAGGPHIAG